MSQHIFLDESGDLGFNKNKRNSKYFIIAIIFTIDKKPLEKIVKKVHSSLRKKVKRLSGGILHSHKEKPLTRKRLLENLKEKDITIMTIYLDKSKVYSHLRNEKHILYNYVTNILMDRIMTRKYLDKNKEILLTASKRETTKFLNDNFTKYLESQLKNKHKVLIKIEIKTPSEEKSLQAVDFVTWAIFRKYEFKDDSYYQIIKNKIVEERGLFS
mgnify:CR=1 FL=1